jgi:signal transduction histidine kinase
MAASQQPSPPWPAFTQLLQLMAALEADVADQHTTLTAVRDSQERLRQRVAALRQARPEEQRLEHEAQRANSFALLGRLAAGLAHELRNPLGVIFLHVELLEEEWHRPSADRAIQVTESLNDIKMHLLRLDDRIRDYLSLLQLERLEYTRHDLGAVVQAWVVEWQAQAQARRVKLAVEHLEQLGIVALHPSTFSRAVRNLVLNALEAMPQGGTVTLAGEGRATEVQLHVCDGGSGIPAAQLPQIFDPLYTTKPGGTGLGLYLVQQIVAAHGGQVGVESVEGEGTTVTITLPRAAAA